MRISMRRGRSFGGFALLALLGWALSGHADEVTFTRVYQLKNVDAANCIRAINFAVPDVAQKRILSGQGRKLVVTDVAVNQDEIASLLPVIDQAGKETDPRRAQIEITVRVANFLNHKKKNSTMTSSGAAGAGASAPAARRGDAGPPRNYDTKRSTEPYKSVYSDEDVQLMKKPRVVRDDPVLPAINNLTLKGIFLISSNKPMALLTYENSNFTARDGGLYYFNRTLVKGYTCKVLKDRVVITGPDRIPREVKFKTSL